MSREMSVREFQEEFSGKEGRFFFSYKDQRNNGSLDNFVRFQIQFDSVLVVQFPNAIMFRSANKKQMMCLDGVRSVVVDNDKTIGTVLDIHCGYGGNTERVYRFLYDEDIVVE